MSFTNKMRNWFLENEDDYDDEDEYTNSTLTQKDVENQMVNKKKVNKNAPSIVPIKPLSREKIYEAADCLKRNDIVILDLNRNTQEDINQIMDFLGGVVYAINGVIIDVAPNTYMLSPEGINIDSEENSAIDYLYGADIAHTENKNNNVAQQVRPTGNSFEMNSKINKEVVRLK